MDIIGLSYSIFLRHKHKKIISLFYYYYSPNDEKKNIIPKTSNNK